MHIFFSGIGGTAIGPLALIAKEAGYEVSGSDKQDSQYIAYLKKHGIENIHIGQTKQAIQELHQKHPIDWYVYSSAVSIENPDAAELRFTKEQGIKMSKRDELLNLIIEEKQLQLIAVAGTHGKTTTTSLLIWLFHELDVPISYSVGAKISFGDMGQYKPGADYFIYEADEFDRNFLAFTPYLSLITGVSWDHHEIFPTREDYQAAFRDFMSQSQRTILWQEDYDYLQIPEPTNLIIQASDNPMIEVISLKGQSNRLDAWLAIQAVHRLTKEPVARLIEIINRFPGLQRRMEAIIPNLYSDYAHTPEKVRGAMGVAKEIAVENDQPLIVLYEPLTNRRQHYVIDQYKDCFDGASKLYWLPSYLAREDPDQHVLSPEEMIAHLSDPSLAEPAAMDKTLQENIEKHLREGAMVVAMTGGGGHSLDEWLRKTFGEGS